MKIKESVVQAWLDSIAEKQTDNVRFIPVVLDVKVKKHGIVELTITTESGVMESETIELTPGGKLTIPGCYSRVCLDT